MRGSSAETLGLKSRQMLYRKRGLEGGTGQWRPWGAKGRGELRQGPLQTERRAPTGTPAVEPMPDVLRFPEE